MSGVAPSARTAMTARELLVNNSEMRELMRSVSPISEPGLIMRKKGKRGKKSPTREQTPLVSATRDPSASKGDRKKKKKKDKKKDGKVKGGKKKRALTTLSPSHYAPGSPTPQRPDASATPIDAMSTAQSGPSHWQGQTEPSQSVHPRGKPKKGARARNASPFSDQGRGKKRKAKVELRGRK